MRTKIFVPHGVSKEIQKSIPAASLNAPQGNEWLRHPKYQQPAKPNPPEGRKKRSNQAKI